MHTKFGVIWTRDDADTDADDADADAADQSNTYMWSNGYIPFSFFMKSNKNQNTNQVSHAVFRFSYYLTKHKIRKKS